MKELIDWWIPISIIDHLQSIFLTFGIYKIRRNSKKPSKRDSIPSGWFNTFN